MIENNDKIQRIHLDLDALRETAMLGVRRAAVFLGLGLNAASDPSFKDYQLSKLSRDSSGEVWGLTHSFVPEEAAPEVVEGYKQEFALWVVNNGLRELVERFALFLDQLHEVCLFCFHTTQVRRFHNHRDLQVGFVYHSGVDWKLRKIDERFGIRTTYSDLLSTLYSARNCLSHRLGVVVQNHDCGEDGLFHLRWLGMDVFMTYEDGSRVPLESVIGIPLERAGTMVFQFSERDLTFAPGDIIKFKANQIAEICFFITQATEAMMTATIKRFNEIGIPVNSPNGKSSLDA